MTGKELSLKVAKLYKIEPYFHMYTNFPNGYTCDVLWLHEDSKRCLELMYENNLQVDPVCTSMKQYRKKILSALISIDSRS